MTRLWPLTYDVVDCPTCGQPKGHNCRTRNTNRVTNIHIPRWKLALKKNRRRLRS